MYFSIYDWSQAVVLTLAGPIDVALNSLTSPGMVAATLACLGPHARLSEISKRDIWSPARVAQERPDVDYKLVAIDFLPMEVTLTSCMDSPMDGVLALQPCPGGWTGKG